MRDKIPDASSHLNNKGFLGLFAVSALCIAFPFLLWCSVIWRREGGAVYKSLGVQDIGQSLFLLLMIVLYRRSDTNLTGTNKCRKNREGSILGFMQLQSPWVALDLGIAGSRVSR